jgi:hypothetical protein
MRVIGEIPHPDCKITIFHWNNRYLIKLEQGPLEQTFKIQEFDLGSEDELHTLVQGDFLESALKRFEAMGLSLQEAMQKL